MMHQWFETLFGPNPDRYHRPAPSTPADTAPTATLDDHQARRMRRPLPTPEMLADPVFNAVWDLIRDLPGADGRTARAIVEVFHAAVSPPTPPPGELPVWKCPRCSVHNHASRLVCCECRAAGLS